MISSKSQLPQQLSPHRLPLLFGIGSITTPTTDISQPARYAIERLPTSTWRESYTSTSVPIIRQVSTFRTENDCASMDWFSL
jgi:hypothetical protein